VIEFRRLTRQRLKRMLAAGEDVLSCQRALEKGGLNIVGEVLRGQGTFYEWTHYPEGDVFDRDSHAQYYYHAHRSAPDEHGHFHLFLRKAGMPDGIGPAPHAGSTQDWPTGEGQLSHLVAVAMDSHGWPIRLFCTTRWVTGETWYRAEDVVRMLDRFVVDHAYPSWPVNRKTSWPLAASQSWTRPSEPAVASSRPSAEKATPLASTLRASLSDSVCQTGSPVATSHSRSPSFVSRVARVRPSGA